ncbi:hypothetical protein VP01_344g7, partial [Puccinia sorghi]
ILSFVYFGPLSFPAIRIFFPLALSVRSDTLNAKRFQQLLKHELTQQNAQLPRLNRYPGANSILVCDNAFIHQGPRVKQLCDGTGVFLVTSILPRSQFNSGKFFSHGHTKSP